MRITPGLGGPAGGFGVAGLGAAARPSPSAARERGDFPSGGGGNIKASILEVDGTLYLSTPDNAWAMDARSGRELWHYFWKTKGGTHIGSRGMAMWHDYVYFETPDNYLVSLEAKTGKERWHKVISRLQPAVLLHDGADRDRQPRARGDGQRPRLAGLPAVVRSRDRRAAVEVLYRAAESRRSRSRDMGQPRRRAAWRRAGWIPGSYDPDTKLYIFGTGNPTPAYTEGRGEGDNLFTCTLIAVNVDTGKMAWYYQTSPHDKHDWDSAQTPVLFDGQIDGKPRKLVATAARNGYFFVLDRTTGERLVSGPFGPA